jgi:kynureninase
LFAARALKLSVGEALFRSAANIRYDSRERGKTAVSEDHMRKQHFHLPQGVIYLDGNSLGPLPKKAAERLARTVSDEWGDLLIKGWNEAGWFHQPVVLGNRLAPLIGAPQNSVVLGDTLSIKVYQALAAGLKMRPGRKVILSDTGNFPTDLYMAEGLIKLMDSDIELKVVPPEQVENHLDDNVAVMMLTQVDYRTGRLHDMASLTQKAHEKGAVALWDLAHSAGALPVELEACNVEFAVGCTYKYLNAGPGSPAFIYVRPDLAAKVEPALSGWMGHALPFAFDIDYQPSPSIERMRVGTPPVLQMAALDAALDVWEGVSLRDVRARSIELSELFIGEVENRCPQLTLVSPRASENRGSQVSFAFEEGYAAMQALIAAGVIGDFRAPDVMRFGFTPLYIDTEDVLKAVAILEDIMCNRTWDQHEFKQRAAVT